MKLIEKIRNFVVPKKKFKVLIKSKFGLPTVRVCGVQLTDGGANAQGQSQTGFATGANQQQAAVTAAGSAGFATNLAGSGGANNFAQTFAPAFAPKMDLIEEIYVKNNKDAKDLIIGLNGVVTMGFGTANEQYEVIRISYSEMTLDLNTFIKIYSFSEGDKIIFAKDSKQKTQYLNIVKSMNISSISVVDLVYFE
jgi:hypothetical protein